MVQFEYYWNASKTLCYAARKGCQGAQTNKTYTTIETCLKENYPGRARFLFFQVHLSWSLTDFDFHVSNGDVWKDCIHSYGWIGQDPSIKPFGIQKFLGVSHPQRMRHHRAILPKRIQVLRLCSSFADRIFLLCHQDGWKLLVTLGTSKLEYFSVHTC